MFKYSNEKQLNDLTEALNKYLDEEQSHVDSVIHGNGRLVINRLNNEIAKHQEAKRREFVAHDMAERKAQGEQAAKEALPVMMELESLISKTLDVIKTLEERSAGTFRAADYTLRYDTTLHANLERLKNSVKSGIKYAQQF